MEPFRQTYAIKEIKNVLTDRLAFAGADYTSLTSVSDDIIMPRRYEPKFKYSWQRPNPPTLRPEKQSDISPTGLSYSEVEKELLQEHNRFRE